VSDNIVQPLTLEISTRKLTVDNDCLLSRRSTINGLSYKQEGRYSYTVALKSNSLFSSPVLTGGAEKATPSSSIGTTSVIFLPITDTMKASYAYAFKCSPDAKSVSEDVSVTATLAYTGVWTKSFTLVPVVTRADDFQLYFSLDLNDLQDELDDLRTELGFGAPSYRLTIEAKVQTVAQTDYGTINEVFTHSLAGDISTSTMVWDLDSGLRNTKSGTILGRGSSKPNPEKVYGLSVGTAQVVFPILLVVFLIITVGLIIIFVPRRYRRRRVSESEKELRNIQRKFKGMLSEIEALPELNNITVITLDSPESMLNTAQGLFKPILHYTNEGQHNYVVLDGEVMCQYLFYEY
jgi:hypothetical protein